MKNIALIGMPGSGKTTFGKGLARILRCPFVDADDYLEKKEGRTIQSFFAESDKAFRDAGQVLLEPVLWNFYKFIGRGNVQLFK
jgi:shikimate kinase